MTQNNSKPGNNGARQKRNTKATEAAQKRRRGGKASKKPQPLAGPPPNGQDKTLLVNHPGFFSAADVDPEEADFLLEPWIPRKGLTVVCGFTNMGKSTFFAAVVADVTGGPRLRGGEPRPGENVLLLTGEEDIACMTVPRLIRANADRERVKFYGQYKSKEKIRRLTLPSQLSLLAQLVRELEIRLIVFDPITRYADPGIDFNNEIQTRSILDPLQDLSYEEGIPVLITRNPNKSKSDSLMDKINGSAAFRDVPRSVLFLAEDPKNSEQRVLLQEKCSISENAKAFGYELPRINRVPRFQLLREVNLTGRDVIEAFLSTGERAEWEFAHQLVRGLIGDEWIRSALLEKRATEESVSKSKLWRAKRELKVQTRKQGTGEGSWWEVGPPEGGWPPDLNAAVSGTPSPRL